MELSVLVSVGRDDQGEEVISPLQYILGIMGYAKIPVEVVQLAIKLSDDLYVLGVDDPMYCAAKTLEGFLRSCRQLG